MVFQTEKALEEVGDKISPNDKAEVEADLNSLKEAINRAPVEEMTDAQVEDIKSGKEKLMNSAQKLFAKVYEQAQAAGAAGAGPGSSGLGSGRPTWCSWRSRCPAGGAPRPRNGCRCV